MRLGFPAYLELLIDRPADFEKLMAVNMQYCLAWAGAQVRAGADEDLAEIKLRCFGRIGVMGNLNAIAMAV
jgi:hypothetical protein